MLYCNALRVLGSVVGAALVASWGLVGCESETAPPPPPDGPTRVDIQIPGFPPQPEPADNPTTVEGVELGRRLFYDPILSSDQTISCSSCHRQEFAFADPRPFSVGVRDQVGAINAPAIVNAGWNPAQFWDGRAETLEIQAIEPVHNPTEMDLPWEQAVERLQQHPEYPDRFEAAFGTDVVTRELAAKAIAQFERTLISYNAKWDRVDRLEIQPTAAEAFGRFAFDAEALTPPVGTGAGGDCFHCHGHPTLYTPLGSGTAGFFEDNGLDLEPDPGLMAVTGQESDRGKFKVPTLRNIAVTAPYMHDSRFATLEEVLDHYSHGYVDSPNLNTKMRARLSTGTREMSEETKANIIQFLHTLTDEQFLTDPAFSDPFQDDN